MKKSLLTYAVTVIAVIALSVSLLFLLSAAAVHFLDNENKKYLPAYISGERGISSPWYKNGLHIVDEAFMDELDDMKDDKKDIVVIGSSLSVISFNADAPNDDMRYPYRFLVCGNGCYKSDRQLYELYKAAGAEHPGDIIKLEVSWSTFRDMEKSITQSTVDKWKRYSINSDDTASSAGFLMIPVSRLNMELIKLQNVYELADDYVKKARLIHNAKTGEAVVPGNFKNSYFDYEAVAESCNMTEEMQESLMDLIFSIHSGHKLVIELSPLPAGLKETDYGREFDAYIDEELIPALEKNGICFYDYRDDFSDEEFCDGVHLGYEAGLKYTKKVNEDMNGVIDHDGFK